MRNRCLRMLAVLLVLCLLLESGDASGVSFMVNAEQESSSENSIKSIDGGDTGANSGSDTPSDGGTQSDGGNGGNGGAQTDDGNGGAQTDGGNGGNGGAQSDDGNGGDTGANSGSDTPSDDGNIGATPSGDGNDGNGGAQSDDGNGGNGGAQTDDGNDGNGDTGADNGDAQTDDADDSLTDNEDDEDAQELFADGIALFADAVRLPLPDDPADYETGKIYVITKPEDYLKLQEHSAQTDFEGIEFRVNSENTENIKIGKDFLTEAFVGFGTEAYPFRGKLSSDYTSGSIKFELEQPLFAYLGSGAEIFNLGLICKEGTPSAITETIRFEDGETEPVYLHDIKITGDIKKSGAAVGTIAGSCSDNAAIRLENFSSGLTAVEGAVAGGIAGEAGSGVSVEAADTTLGGEVIGSTAAGSCYGTVTGSHVWTETEMTLRVAASEKVSGDSGSYLGGLAGKLRTGSGRNRHTFEDSGDTMSVTARIDSEAGGIGGGLFGMCESGVTVEIEKPLAVSGMVSAATAGGVVGEVTDDGNFTWKLVSFSGSAQISGKRAAGGVVGSISADGFEPEGIGGDEPEFTIGGPVSAQVTGGLYGAGGYAGAVSGSVRIPYITVEQGTKLQASCAGGVVGLLDGGRCIFRGAELQSGSSIGNGGGGGSESGAGGVIGVATGGASAELQGHYTMECSLPDGIRGSVAGRQEQSLLYFSDPVQKGAQTEQLTLSAYMEGWKEIGGGGGVFRNQEAGKDSLLIGDGTLDEVGRVHTGYVTGSMPTFTLKGTNGMECLAIALWTEGNYGMEPFGETDGASDRKEKVVALLQGAYTLSGDADISYDTAGIVTINQNVSKYGEHAFAGSLRGALEGTKITQNSRTYLQVAAPYERQQRVGIFSTITGDTVFENLCIDGDVTYAQGAGGIAYRSIGSSLTLKQIEMKKRFSNLYNAGGEAECSIGGVLAREESSVDPFVLTAEDITLANEIDAGSDQFFSGFVTTAENIDAAVKGVTIGGSMTSTTTSTNETGGFLGRSWNQCQGYVGAPGAGVKIADTGAVYNTSAKFGGMFALLRNKSGEYVTLQEIDLDGLTVNDSGRQQQCSLLVRNGRMLAANIVDYSAKGCKVNGAGSKFDEISGTVNNNSNTTSGILSLHSTKAGFPAYHYEEQATYTDCTGRADGVGGKASYDSDARYFYDVFQVLEDMKNDPPADVNTIRTPEQMLLWSAYCNINEEYYSGNPIKAIFQPYVPDSGTVTLNGTIDLKNVSFYPLPNRKNITVNGSGGAKLIFHAAEMNDTAGDGEDGGDAAWGLPANLLSGSIGSQHYGLHSGFFLNVKALEASALTLSGTVTYRGGCSTGAAGGFAADGSGALVAGTLSDGGSFTDIVLDDLWIDGFDDHNGSGDNKQIGLLISLIVADNSDTRQTNTVDVTFGSAGTVPGAGKAGVTMKNYPQPSAKNAAAALIGMAGASNMTNLKLDFRNMRLADDKAGEEKHNGHAFAYASYLYNYQHTSKADAYTGRCWYLFTQEEAETLLTYGSEIDGMTEYWWEDEAVPDPHKPYVVDNLRDTDDPDFDPADFLPYVFWREQIEVNPKPGDITTGCGTYEDPYVIDSAKQFLTLYRYVNMMEENSTAAEDVEFFKSWKVNRLGTDDVVCNKAHAVTDAVTFGTDPEAAWQDGFPTQKELRGAYYQLAADIDLSDITSGNYKMIADNFSGFGTEKYPFTGVWYGKDSIDGTIHTVTLPKKNSTQKYTAYGFLQYAKGVVVKDMNIASPTVSSYVPRLADFATAGGVISCVLGGDNIIDNVTVQATYMLTGSTTFDSAHGAVVGGYVGCVKKGGVILRNITLAQADGFRLLEANSGSITYNADESQAVRYTAGKKEAFYLGAVAGRVEDGYLLHEGGGDTSAPLWESGSMGGYNGTYCVVPFYDIVNGDYLEMRTKSVPLPSVGAVSADGGIAVTASLPNAAALQALSMALNADALNTKAVSDSEEKQKGTYGYTLYSKSRKAAYSHIGCGTGAASDAAAKADYEAAVLYDNQKKTGAEKQTYPYLWKYLGITADDSGQFMHDGASVFNTAEELTAGGGYYRTVWKLTGSGEYDLSVFGDAFRGLGAGWDIEGGDSSSSYSCGGTFLGSFDGNGKTVRLARRSTALRRYQGAAYTPVSLRSIGFFNTVMKGSKDDSAWQEATGGVTVRDLMVTGSVRTGNTENGFCPVDAGGVIGKLNGAQAELTRVTAENLTIDGGALSDNDNTYGNAGGLVAVCTGSGSRTDKPLLTLTDCSAVKTDTASHFTMTEQVGGLVGDVNISGGIVITNGNTAAEGLSILSYHGNAGGVIGCSDRLNKTGELTVTGAGAESASSPLVKGCEITAYYNAGGVVGKSRSKTTLSQIGTRENTICSYQSTGGMVGEMLENAAEFTDITVLDSSIRERELTSSVVYQSTAGNGQGGILGRSSTDIAGNADNLIKIVNATVAVSKAGAVCEIRSVQNARGIRNGVGGIVGYHDGNGNKALYLENCLADGITAAADVNESSSTPACAGGIVGASYNTVAADGYLHTRNAVITAPALSYQSAGERGAGGCFGYVRSLRSPSGDYYRGMSAEDNTVEGKQAGGLIGIAETSSKEIRLGGSKDQITAQIPGGTQVNGGSVTGTRCAGGIFGLITVKEGVAALNKEMTSDSQAAAAPVITIKNMAVSGKYAGGIAGSINVYNFVRFENLEIRDCIIKGDTLKTKADDGEEETGGCAVGGVIGTGGFNHENMRLYHIDLTGNQIFYEARDTKLNDTEASAASDDQDHISVGGLIGRTDHDIASAAGKLLIDDVLLSKDNRVGVRQKDAADAEYMLVGEDDRLTAVTKPAQAASLSAAAGELAEDYGCYVGTLIGTMCSEKTFVYMMRVYDTEGSETPPVLSQTNAPVSDVGRLPGEERNAYRGNAHVLYGTLASGEDYGEKNVAQMDAVLKGGVEKSYEGNETLPEILTAYRLPQEVTVKEAEGASAAVTKTLSDFWAETYALKGSVSGGAETLLPVLRLKPGTFSIDAQIKLLSDIMTNVSGLSSSNMQILTIAQNQVSWDLTNDTRSRTENVAEEDAHILIGGTADGGYTFSYNGLEFDTRENDVLNYTELVYTYRLADGHERRFVLPLYVEEPLVLDVQAKLLAGRISSEEAMADGITDNAMLATDSDYTLSLDFSYSDARENYVTPMEKHIYLTNKDGVKQFDVGTKLLLIDQNDGGKPYYYTVTENTGTEYPDGIPFSAFTDTGLPAGTDGTNAYTELPIDRTQNPGGTDYDGHDRYLLQILPGDKSENSIYDIHVGFKNISDDNKAEYGMVGTTEAVINVDAIPGLQFQLLVAGSPDNKLPPQNGTDVTGKLEENAVLTLDMEYLIYMDPAYKDKGDPMDSANNGKYLDLGFYLTDSAGRRVPLPDGTNIRYTADDGSTATTALTDCSAGYYYKDIMRMPFLIRSDGTQTGITDTVQGYVQIEIMLPSDLSQLTEDSYKVHIDLLRSDDAEHPSGYEDALDVYEETITAKVIPKLGFAVTVDEADWERLGVNTYSYDDEFAYMEENGTQIHEIPFRVQIDFRNILKQVSGDEIEMVWASKDYYITYQIFGKQTDGSYPETVFTDGASPQTMRVAARDDSDPDGAYAVSSGGELVLRYRLTKDEIEANADTLLSKGTPVEREGKVILNMEQLKGLETKAELEQYLTNYMMKATLQITEQGVAPSAIAADDVNDFFIYTVTKLKTDIG